MRARVGSERVAKETRREACAVGDVASRLRRGASEKMRVPAERAHAAKVAQPFALVRRIEVSGAMAYSRRGEPVKFPGNIEGVNK